MKWQRNAAIISLPYPIQSASSAPIKITTPKPTSPNPVTSPTCVWVNPNCVAQSARIPPRTPKPTPAARMAMKPTQRSRFALGATALAFPLLIVCFCLYWLKGERRKLHYCAAFERGFMGAQAHTGPVGRLLRVREWIAILSERHRKFVRQMRMAAAVAAALREAEVRLLG